MLVQLLSFIGTLVERSYALHIIVGIVLTYLVRLWANGERTDRDRNMHGRVVLLTGALTPVGAAIMDQLARRGTQIIALVPSLKDPIIQEIIPAMRTATNNELIFAEECDLGSIASIRTFCQRLTQLQPNADGRGQPEPSRLDAVIFMHEYLPVVPDNVMLSYPDDKQDGTTRRSQASMATFLLTTLILPSLLRAPSDRDIRFINVVNSLYAAAIPLFNPTRDAEPSSSLFSKEGYRSLRSIILGKHLQRVFDALVTTNKEKTAAGPLIDPSRAETLAPAMDRLYKGSNILSITVSPGYHFQYVRQLLSSAPLQGILPSILSRIFMLLFYPLGIIMTKSASSASQTILHTLFLPHPIKSIVLPPSTTSTSTSHTTTTTTNTNTPKKLDGDTGVLTGGQLYRDNKPVILPAHAQENLVEKDDVGRAVWEYFESGLKTWEEMEEKAQQQLLLEKTKATTAVVDEKVDEGKGEEAIIIGAQGTVPSSDTSPSR